jgi:hypothetical protein
MMATWYHDSLATGANNGTSWADAFTDIASLNSKANYDTVYTRNGQTITTALTLTKYLYIIGCNAAGVVDGTRSVFDFNNSANSITFADYTDCFNITFRRSTATSMVSAGWYSGWYNCRFELASVYGLVLSVVFNIDGCEFSGITNFSLQASTGRNGTLSNSSFIDTNGVYLANCFVAIDRCVFKVTSSQAISINAGGYPSSVTRSCFYGATTYHIFSTSYNNYVAECRFEGGPIGIRLDNNDARVALRNNTFYSVTNKTSLATRAKAHDMGNGLYQSSKSQFVNAAGGNLSSIPDADLLGVPLIIGGSTAYVTAGLPPAIPAAGGGGSKSKFFTPVGVRGGF